MSDDKENKTVTPEVLKPKRAAKRTIVRQTRRRLRPL